MRRISDWCQCRAEECHNVFALLWSTGRTVQHSFNHRIFYNVGTLLLKLGASHAMGFFEPNKQRLSITSKGHRATPIHPESCSGCSQSKNASIMWGVLVTFQGVDVRSETAQGEKLKLHCRRLEELKAAATSDQYCCVLIHTLLFWSTLSFLLSSRVVDEPWLLFGIWSIISVLIWTCRRGFSNPSPLGPSPSQIIRPLAGLWRIWLYMKSFDSGVLNQEHIERLHGMRSGNWKCHFQLPTLTSFLFKICFSFQ